MDYFFYNTDANALSEQPRPRFPVLIEGGFAAVGGDRQQFGEQLGQLAPDDILLMYENGVGVVAIGFVQERWDGVSHTTPQYYRPAEMGGLTGGPYEYRVSVEWFLDLSSSPIGIEQLREQLGYTPRGTVRRIVEQRTVVARIIEEARASLPLLPGRHINLLVGPSERTPMNINSFFTDTLGAQLKNARWSWGAVHPVNHRVFLRIWQDGLRMENGKEYFHIARDVPRRKSNGFPERHNHIALIRGGAEGYGVVCVAVDPDTTEARKIKSFDDQFLVQFGEITKDGGDTLAEVVARVPVADLARPKTGESTLADDLQAIARRKLEATTKEAMINARVGQGLFRQQVLKNWENKCAVTGSTVLDAIRASHIKPWRNSDDNERLDAFNGLPLIASLDALFDAGLISFNEQGSLLVSSRLTESELSIFGLAGQALRKLPPKEAAVYLAYHRLTVFRT